MTSLMTSILFSSFNKWSKRPTRTVSDVSSGKKNWIQQCSASSNITCYHVQLTVQLRRFLEEVQLLYDGLTRMSFPLVFHYLRDNIWIYDYLSSNKTLPGIILFWSNYMQLDALRFQEIALHLHSCKFFHWKNYRIQTSPLSRESLLQSLRTE